MAGVRLDFTFAIKSRQGDDAHRRHPSAFAILAFDKLIPVTRHARRRPMQYLDKIHSYTKFYTLIVASQDEAVLS